MLMQRFFSGVFAVLVLAGTASCSMLIRQNNPPPAKEKTSAAKETKAGIPADPASSASDTASKNRRAVMPEPEKKQKVLTADQLARMSPDELRQYLKDREDEARLRASGAPDPAAESAKKHPSFGSLIFREDQHRKNVRDVSRQLTPEETGSAFPWRGTPGARSGSLLEQSEISR